MIRPQAKDMYNGGMDALQMSMGGKKAKQLQPPANASPGELRLWRKLNGMLDPNEQKVDAHEHGKAASRQMKYPGTKARAEAAAVAAAGNRRISVVSDNSYLYGEVNRQQGAPPVALPPQPQQTAARKAPPSSVAPPRVASVKPKPPRAGSPQRSPQSSPKGVRPPTPTRKATPPKRAESPAKARPAARRPSPRDGSPRAMPPKAPAARPKAPPRPAAPPPRRHDSYDEEPEEEEEEYYEAEGYEAEAGAYDEDDASHRAPDACDGYEDDAASAGYGSADRSESLAGSLSSEYAEEHGESSASESKTPSPVATGAVAQPRTSKRSGGASGKAAMAQIEELLPSLSLDQKKTLQGRLAELVEMHELRQMIAN